MTVTLNRIILYVQDVERLAAFYREAFGFVLGEYIENEWSVLVAGGCEVSLHRAGAAWRVAKPSTSEAKSNAKLVFTIDDNIDARRA